MNKFLLITKINLLRSFSLTKNNNSKYKSERRKKSLRLLGIAVIISYILFYVYYITKSLMPSFVMIGKPLYMIGFLFVICTLYIFFANLFRIKSILFDFKDYDLLMSLPVKRSIVITSKIVSLYILNLIYTLIVMIPGYIAYIKYANMPNDVLFFLLLLTIPIIPILLSSIVGIVLTWLTSFFRNRNIGSYVVNLLVIFLAFFISFKISSLNDAEVANQSINMVNSFGHYYPFTTLFVDLLSGFNAIGLLIYFFLPVLLMFAFIMFINKGYIYLRSRLLRTNIKSDYEVKRYRVRNALGSLYIKEIKKYFSNSLYVINTAFGCIAVIILIISMLLFNENLISRFTKIMDFNEVIKTNIFFILSILCAVSSTTNSSISLEGKSLWIMKSLPVSADQIFLSKIMVNLTILVPTIIIGGTFFGIYLHLPFSSFLLLYLMPLTYAVFISVGGLLLNLMFPKFEFDNEIRVIKQSLPVFLTLLIGAIMVLIPFKILNSNSIGLITSIMFLIDVILAIVLHVYGNRKMIKL